MYLVTAGKLSWVESCRTKKKAQKAVDSFREKGYKKISVYKKEVTK